VFTKSLTNRVTQVLSVVTKSLHFFCENICT